MANHERQRPLSENAQRLLRDTSRLENEHFLTFGQAFHIAKLEQRAVDLIAEVSRETGRTIQAGPHFILGIAAGYADRLAMHLNLHSISSELVEYGGIIMNHVVAHSMESELPLYRQLHATQPPNTMAWIVDERPFFRFIAERFTDCLDPTAVTKKRLESAFSTFNRTSSDAILTHVDSGDRITVGAMQRDPKYFGLRPNDRHLFKEYLNLSLGTDELGRMAAIEGARGDAIENWQEMHKERWKAHTLYLPTAMLDLAYNPLKEYADALANNTLDKEFIQIKIAVASMYSLIPAPAFGRYQADEIVQGVSNKITRQLHDAREDLKLLRDRGANGYELQSWEDTISTLEYCRNCVKKHAKYLTQLVASFRIVADD